MNIRWIVGSLSVAALIGSSAYGSPVDGNKHFILAGIHYAVPQAYHSRINSEYGVFIQVARIGFGPLLQDLPGWDDQVNILTIPQYKTIPEMYAVSYDGTSKYNRILSSETLPDGSLKNRMESGSDVIIPVQDMRTMPVGIIECPNYTFGAPWYQSCYLLFRHEGQSWQVTFGVGYISEFQHLKAQAVTLFDSFKVRN